MKTQRLVCAAGHCLYRAGQPAEHVYWLEQGAVGIWSRSPTGLFQVVCGPALLGSELLVASRCRHTMLALQPCQLTLLNQNGLRKIIRAHPRLLLWLLCQFSQETILTLPHYE
jgi:CRP-like cAMP-binding protein